MNLIEQSVFWFSFSILLLLISSGTCVRVLEFQSDNVPKITSKAVKFFSPEVTLRNTSVSSVSVCLWVKVNFFRSSGTMYAFSYATSDKNNNDLNLGVATDEVHQDETGFVKTKIKIQKKSYMQIVLTVSGKYFMSIWGNVKIWPLKWHHICFTVNSNFSKLFVDGKSVELNRPEGKEFELLLNGSFVLGQETDTVNGGFNELQSFCGQVARLNIWSSILSEDQILQDSKCSSGKNLQQGDLFSLDSAKFDETNNVNDLTINIDEICSQQIDPFIAFPETLDLQKADRFCKKISRSSVYVPKDETENERLYQSTNQWIGTCKARNHATGYLFLGMQNHNDAWTDMMAKPLNYTNFGTNSNPKATLCVGLESPPAPGNWNDLFCNLKLCFSCSYDVPVRLVLRGLCIEKNIEAYFLPTREDNSTKYVMRGYLRYEIVYFNNVWILRDMWQNKTVAFYVTNQSLYPLGSANWTVAEEYIICNLQQAHMDEHSVALDIDDDPSSGFEEVHGVQHVLTLSSCLSTEYTCKEGSCIPLEKRCDLRVDCLDSSDEMNCEKLRLPFGYMSNLPPPGRNQSHLNVQVSIIVHGLSEINHKNMLITVDMTMTYLWNDLRVMFSNIKNISALNYIDPSHVWVPTVEYVNADFPMIKEAKPLLTAIRESEPEKDNIERAVRDELFQGEFNFLKLKQRIKAPFSCHMELSNFPFDVQTCFVKLKEASGEQLVRWETVDVDYLGESMLTEFKVEKMTASLSSEDNYSLAKVRIQLQRRYSYYVTTAYLPTLMLIVISYASLFCKLENIDLRVMMSVTILIVLYTLYQQISDGLPKTSYSKAIDIWCFFALSLIFSQVVFHVILEVEIFPGTNSSVQSVKSATRSRPSGKLYYIKVARVAYIVIFVVFCLIYWIYVLYQYNAMQQ